ncbi:TetR family transcriptional regulator [Mycobacterium gordonae]|jgi:AcrR family transcriptional regulator|uniref:TetR/AcrR family transcriptional regulator n=1 Tax=Mycobacterium paragordonae TaxID=1389713 RepID=UPI0007EF0D43|nr:MULTISPECIES: TetR/AcrR family transcriptional regulator [Mycobacterium]OBK56838.1 TetR family transcriptional regulator [Mycobacterium gordonae]
MTQASASAPGTDTREVILDAAYACFRKQGLLKTTIVDIAREANISRSTIYEYFRDKGAILEACAEHASEQFYREMSRAMARGGSLEEKLSNAAVFVTQARRAIASEEYFDEDAISLLLTKDAAVLLRECIDFFAPYFSAAKLTGEVRKDLDVESAGEWFARILFSLFSTASPIRDMDDPGVVAEFVSAFAVRGFAGDRPVRGSLRAR